jgi:hypothetical protein
LHNGAMYGQIIDSVKMDVDIWQNRKYLR